MAQTNLTIRIDDGLKREAEILFSRIGLNMTSAINVFFRQALREQAIPFELKSYDDNETNRKINEKMFMQDIYDKLSKSESDFAEGRTMDAMESLKQIREKYDV